MILKKGDNNEIVKKIQVVLGVDPVGNFGPKTEEAVKAWQTKNGLKPDGIVGPASLAKMGIVVEGKVAAPAAAPRARTWRRPPDRPETARTGARPPPSGSPPRASPPDPASTSRPSSRAGTTPGARPG